MSQKQNPTAEELAKQADLKAKAEAKKNDEKSKRKAKQLDKDVESLKTKELQSSKIKSNFNQDLVANKSWQTTHGATAAKQDELITPELDDDTATQIASSEAEKTPSETEVAAAAESPTADETELAKQQIIEEEGSTETTGIQHFSGFRSNAPLTPALTPTLTPIAHSLSSDQVAFTITMVADQAVSSITPLPNPAMKPGAIQASSTNKPQLQVDAQPSQDVTEDAAIDTVSGHLIARGLKSATVIWSSDHTQGQFGELVLDQNSGQWQYQLDNSATATNALAAGEQHTEQFIITATNSIGDQVNTVIDVVVNGSNDLPQISGVHNASLNEQGSIDTVSGILVATDPDNGDSIQWAVDQSAGLYGQLSIDANGQWQYLLDNNSANTQGLNAGDIASDIFTVTATDSSGQPVSQTVTIDVHGTDQTATINGIFSSSLVEGQNLIAGNLHTDGQLSITDPDSGQSYFVAETIQGQLGSLAIDATGYWTYTADNSNSIIQALGVGESFTDILVVQSADGTQQQISITIAGSNNAPSVTAVLQSQITDEDAAFSFAVPSGTFADVDTSDTLTLSASGLPAWLNFDANTGLFSGTPTNSDVGVTAITVTATDSQGASVTSTFDLVVNNINDAPVLDPISSVSAVEDGSLVSGQITSTDIDVGDTATYSTTATIAGFVLNADGSYSFDPSDAAYQSLADGQAQTLTIPVTVTDGSGATDTQNLVITITGTNDRCNHYRRHHHRQRHRYR
ncbi:VCBS domain-containing protein [Shewanella sp. Isolate11]|uniref:VCBS domain-containing protein n=1 Tax=Shewanella sp. Isolate11 TaxID=2908530 RepID=UPI001EFC860D|nr:VCBS domain-containing protein [Shewanella sp. Isolate11]MCG9695570.1 VCBS domain-containing protein [Shewanella sp. Isolate11]